MFRIDKHVDHHVDQYVLPPNADSFTIKRLVRYFRKTFMNEVPFRSLYASKTVGRLSYPQIIFKLLVSGSEQTEKSNFQH